MELVEYLISLTVLPILTASTRIFNSVIQLSILIRSPHRFQCLFLLRSECVRNHILDVVALDTFDSVTIWRQPPLLPLYLPVLKPPIQVIAVYHRVILRIDFALIIIHDFGLRLFLKAIPTGEELLSHVFVEVAERVNASSFLFGQVAELLVRNVPVLICIQVLKHL